LASNVCRGSWDLWIPQVLWQFYSINELEDKKWCKDDLHLLCKLHFPFLKILTLRMANKAFPFFKVGGNSDYLFHSELGEMKEVAFL